MSHTPGPWYEDGFLFIGTDAEGNGRGWFRLQDEPNSYLEEEVTANQRLCAAAPDLLKTCKDMVEAQIAGTQEQFDYQLIEAAIAKAEGKS